MSAPIEPPLAALIFDFDGTIIDTEMPEMISVQAVFAEFGAEYTLEDCRASIGRTDHQPWHELLVERAGPIPDLSAVRDRRQVHHSALIAEQEIRPGVVEALERAGAAEVPVAVASSSPLAWVEHHLDERGLSDRFPVVATGDMVPQAKPWPDVFRLAADRLGVDPGGCVAIEDSFNGLTAAKAAGMRCAVVPHAITRGMDFSAADWVLDSLVDFPWSDVGL